MADVLSAPAVPRRSNGNGGQRISFYERSKLVIVTTAGMYGSTESSNVERLKDDVVTVLGIEN